MSSPTVTVVAGNPKPSSRALEAAQLVATAVTMILSGRHRS
jgi:hypothetical protein